MDKKIAQQYVAAFTAHYGEQPIRDIEAAQRAARRGARASQLFAHELDREQMRQRFAESEKQRAEYREKLLAERGNPDYWKAFKILHRHLLGKECHQYVVAGNEAKVFYQSGALPLCSFYLILGYPVHANLKMHIDLLGKSDHIFGRCLLAGGVLFYIETVRTHWTRKPERAALKQAPHKDLLVPVINRDHLGIDGNWKPKRLAITIDSVLGKDTCGEKWAGLADT